MAYKDSIINAYQPDGSSLPGFPIKNIAGLGNGAYVIRGNPLVDDVDGDGKKEILSQYTVFENNSFWSSGYGISLFTHQGKSYPGFPTISRGYDKVSRFGYGLEQPSLADINGDGKKEVVYVDYYDDYNDINPYAEIRAIQLNGTELAGFPKRVDLPVIGAEEDVSYTGVTVADINGDGSQDLVWGYYNKMYVFKYTAGRLDVATGWPYTISADLMGADNTYQISPLMAPAIGNIDGDSENEIVLYLKNSDYCKYNNSYSVTKCRSILLTINYNGTKVGPTYPVFGLANVENRIPISDINGDNKDDIIAPSAIAGQDTSDVLKVFDGSAKQILASQWPVNGRTIAVADIEDGPTASAYPEVVAGGYDGSSHYISVFNVANASLWHKKIPYHYQERYGEPYVSNAVLSLLATDLENDNRPEIIAHIEDINSQERKDLSGIFVWQYPKTKTTKMAFDWPMKYHDAQHTSNAALKKPTPLPPPTNNTVAWGKSSDKPVPCNYLPSSSTSTKVQLATYRPSDGTWNIKNNQGGANLSVQWGVLSDVPVPGNFLQKTGSYAETCDLTVWRSNEGNWYFKSLDGKNTMKVYNWGVFGDIPLRGNIFNASNGASWAAGAKDELVIWRPSNGTWYIKNMTTGAAVGIPWGTKGDVPMLVDYNKDGRDDLVVYRPSNANYYILDATTKKLIKQVFFGLPNKNTLKPMIFQNGKAGSAPALGYYLTDKGEWWSNKFNRLDFYKSPTTGGIPFVLNNYAQQDYAPFGTFSGGNWYIKSVETLTF